jgi:riboflavin kinase/FMN adenylyltransferase
MVSIDQTLDPAMINLGANPTFQNAALSIEAHIINFDQDIYEKQVRFFFIEKIRDEMRFPSPDALAGQLKRDVETAKKQYQIHQRLVQNTAELWEKITFIG